MLIKKLVALWVALLVMVGSALASAEPTKEEEEEGRDLAKQAMDHYKESEYGDALQLFDKARAIYPAAQVLRMTGYTLMALERWVEAADLLEQALASDYKPLLPADVEHAQDNLAEVLQHVSVLTVTSSVPGALVSIEDGDEHGLPYTVRLLPGTYSVLVTADGRENAEEEVAIAGGEAKSVKLDPVPFDEAEPKPRPKPHVKPQPEKPEEPTNMFGWFPHQGIVGLTVAGLGLGLGIAGIAAAGYGASLESAVQENIDAHNVNYDANCSRHRDLCLNDISLINSDGERAQDYINAGIALGVTGAALFAVGGALFFFSEMSPLAPDDADKVSVACAPSLGGLVCAGKM